MGIEYMGITLRDLTYCRYCGDEYDGDVMEINSQCLVVSLRYCGISFR